MTSLATRDATVLRLQRLDACAVSDAMDRLGLTGVATGLPQQAGSQRICGRAITVKIGVGTPPPGPARHLGTTAVELAGPDNVIVVEQRSGVAAGCWGGLLTLGAKLRGVAGVIADGPVRDIDEARAHDFPIFTHTLTALTARGRVVELGTNVGINVCGVSVSPGDYVIANRSAAVSSLLRISAASRRCRDDLRSRGGDGQGPVAGKPISSVMGGDYEHMLQAAP